MNNITICHIPSGNPRNAHMITIDESALKAHLKHGDYEGECIQENISPEQKENSNKNKKI